MGRALVRPLCWEPVGGYPRGLHCPSGMTGSCCMLVNRQVADEVALQVHPSLGPKAIVVYPAEFE